LVSAREQYLDYYVAILEIILPIWLPENYIEKLEESHKGLEVADYEIQNKNNGWQTNCVEKYVSRIKEVVLLGAKCIFSNAIS
jgi:hypothetical protein